MIKKDTLRAWREAPGDAVACPCQGVTKAQVVSAIEAGAYTLPLLKTMTGAGRGSDCKRLHPSGVSCEGDLQALLELYATPPAGTVTGGCGC